MHIRVSCWEGEWNVKAREMKKCDFISSTVVKDVCMYCEQVYCGGLEYVEEACSIHEWCIKRISDCMR